MKKLFFTPIFIFCLSHIAYAGPFIEVGVGSTLGSECITDVEDNGSKGCSKNPLGNVAVGYSYNGFSVQAEHWSSLTEKDKGLNIISVKYRYEFFKD